MDQPGRMAWEALRILPLGSEAEEDITLGVLTWQDKLVETTGNRKSRKRVEIQCTLAVDRK